MFLQLGVLAAAFVMSVSAQSPADLFNQAPPVVDEALRARVSAFYQAHTEGKFRIADKYVAEDSKDIFFEADKRRCRAFTIIRINYSDEFSKASVVTNCDTEVLIPPAGLTKVTMPVASKWKLENGEWFWYVPPMDYRESAFGKMKGGTGGEGVSTIPSGPRPEDLMRAVSADRDRIIIGVDSRMREEVLITNRLPGDVKLELGKLNFKDLKASLDKTELKSGESAKLLVEFEADPAARRTFGSSEDVVITVSPTGAKVGVRVQFVQQN